MTASVVSTYAEETSSNDLLPQTPTISCLVKIFNSLTTTDLFHKIGFFNQKSLLMEDQQGFLVFHTLENVKDTAMLVGSLKRQHNILALQLLTYLTLA